MKRDQLELFPTPAPRWQTITEIEALGDGLAHKAVELRDGYAKDPRASRALFNALVMYGAAEILRRRGYPHK